jgi:hypothetical protein
MPTFANNASEYGSNRTAAIAFSDERHGSRNPGKQLPERSFGSFSGTVPARVCQPLSR